jgi:hypothetical protein
MIDARSSLCTSRGQLRALARVQASRRGRSSSLRGRSCDVSQPPTMSSGRTQASSSSAVRSPRARALADAERGPQAVHDLTQDMHRGRVQRLERLGFEPTLARELSSLHTRNFM